MRKQTELYGYKDDLDNLDNEFIRITSFRLPLLDRIHEEESQFTAHFFLRVRRDRASFAFHRSGMILPVTFDLHL